MESSNMDMLHTSLDETAKAHLMETTRWTKFLGILTMVGSDLFVLFSILFLLMGSRLGGMYSMYGGAQLVGTFIYLLIIAALYIYPGITLYRFSTSMKQGILLGSQELINNGFRYQKNFYRFIGILTIIALIIFLFSVLIGGLAGLSLLSNM